MVAECCSWLIRIGMTGVLGSMLVLSGCGEDEASLSARTSPNAKLIDGSPAVAGQLPGVVYLRSELLKCTGAKVAEFLFLTAGHCALIPNASPSPNGSGVTLREGDAIAITTSLTLDESALQPNNRVARIHVHPAWVENANLADMLNPEAWAGADIAILEVDEPTPDIAVLALDFDDVVEGASLTVLGYGCEKSAISDEPELGSKLKFADTVAVDATIAARTWPVGFRSALHSFTAEMAEILHAQYVVTPGVHPSLTPSDLRMAGLCPGDSGGPLLAMDPQGAWRVVGVNASYGFEPEWGPDMRLTGVPKGSIPIYNLHTRLSHPRIRPFVAEFVAGADAL